MDIAEVLKIADNLMFDSSSKYLDDLQRSIVQGVWDGKTYKEIADNTDRTEGHIRDIAANLFKDISNNVDNKVRKKNFKSIIETSYFANYQNIVQVQNINLCPEPMDINSLPETLRRQIEKRHPNSDRRQVKKRDREYIPDLFSFYGRDRELAKLEQWILEDDCRLIDIYGMSGIGKTALIRQLAAQIGDEFDRVVWVNLSTDRSVVEFIERDLLPCLSIDLMANRDWDLDMYIDALLDRLSKQRCLIILDNLQQFFSSDDLAGIYEDNYRGYQELFRKLGVANHQSCVLLVSCEQPRDFGSLIGETRLIRSFAIDGLKIEAQQQLLEDRGIINGDSYAEQLCYYGGNPLYLNAISTTTKYCFCGKIDKFFQDRRLLLINEIKLILQCQYDRLSSIERQAIEIIAREDRGVSFSELSAASQISPTDLLEVVQSLKQRRLLERTEIDREIVFDLQPIIRAFITL